MTDLYVRQGLKATREGLIEPETLVEVWLDGLADLLSGVSESSFLPLEILATWGRLRRVSEDVIQSLDQTDEWRELDREVRARRHELAVQAVSLLNPDGWLAEAKSLYDAVEDIGATPAELSLWAERLIIDLDDADLVAVAAGDALPAELDSQLTACSQWLADNVDLFTLCSVYIQAVGASMCTDLAAYDLEFAATADKYTLVLDACEEGEADLSFDGSGVFSLEEAKQLLPAGAVHKPSKIDRLTKAMQDADVAVAAKSPPDVEIFHFNWQSPGGEYCAMLAVNPAGEEPIRLLFFCGPDRALQLQDQRVILCGVESIISASGFAEFDRVQIRQALTHHRPLELQVGDQMWDPVEP